MAADLPRAPTAWLLAPLVFGYIVGQALPTAPVVFAFVGSILAGAALASAKITARWACVSWPVIAFVAAMSLSAGYIQHRIKAAPDWEGLPPREALLGIKIDRLFSSSGATGRIHGFAYVFEAEPHLEDLLGRRIYFSVLSSDSNEVWPKRTRLRAVGIIEALSPDTPDEDSFRRFLIRSGACFQYNRIVVRAKPCMSPFWAFCASQNRRLERFLRRGSIENTGVVNVFVAMLLGKRAELSADQRSAFLQTGTLHLFAISGLHIGVVALALHSLLALMRIPKKPAAIIGLGFLFCFVGITGAAPSAVRAFLMVLFFWGARFFTRAPNPVAALANSALLVLLLFPGQLWSPGFQLSYVVVSGILFLGLPLGRHLQERMELFSGLPPSSMRPFQENLARAVRALAMTFSVSLSATLLSSPLSIQYFNIFAPGAVLLNLILIPAAGLVIVAGFISVFLSLLGIGFLAVVFNHAGWLVIGAMEGMVGSARLAPVLFWEARFVAPWFGPVATITMLGSLLICAHHRWRPPACHFAVPFVLFALFLSTVARLTFLTD